jgi:hypothetical protein
MGENKWSDRAGEIVFVAGGRKIDSIYLIEATNKTGMENRGKTKLASLSRESDMKMSNMELSPYEAFMASLTCRAIGFLPQMISEEQLKQKLSAMVRTYPLLNWRLSSTTLVPDSTPTITLAELEEQPKLDFLSKCFSTFSSTKFCELFLVAMAGTTQGAVIISCSHGVCDAPLMVTFICDLLSPSATDFPIVTRPCFADLLKDVPDGRQENSVPNPAEIPVHASAESALRRSQ